MLAYTKPAIGRVDVESENCGCTIFVEFGREAAVVQEAPQREEPPQEEDPCHETEPAPEPEPQPTSPENVLTNTILGADDNGVQVTPFQNTGIPGSDPITVYAPVQVTGVSAHVDLSGASAGVSLADLGASAFGVPLV